MSALAETEPLALTDTTDLLGLYQGDTAPATNQGQFGSVLEAPRRNIDAVNAQFRADLEDGHQVSRCSHSRSVHFPDEDGLVSGYKEGPSSPFQHYAHHQNQAQTANAAPSREEIRSAYTKACQKFGITPSPAVERQIQLFHTITGVRQQTLSLKGERVTHKHIEALEEVLRRVQFESLDFEYTFLDDECIIALAEMLEFYESAQRLNLSFNRAVTYRGWIPFFRAVRNCHSLQDIDMRYSSMSEKALPGLSKMLRAVPPAALTCLHVENCGMTGKNLLHLVGALKGNTTLRELFLGENNIQETDGAHLYQLIVTNTGLTTLDLRNNELKDVGMHHVCDALCNAETLRRSSLQALVVWKNFLTAASMMAVARALRRNPHLETLNLGMNNLGEAGISNLKEALQDSACHLQRLGLQDTKMDNQCAIMIAECMADNEAMVRIDLRDNPGISSAGLLALHSAMRHNKTLTMLNIDETVAAPTTAKVRAYQDDFRRIYEEIQTMCSENRRRATERLQARAIDEDEGVDGKQNEATVSVSTPVREEEGQSASGEQEGGDLHPEEIARSSSVDSALLQKPRSSCRLARSASLTCAEYYPENTIQERLREMSGSTMSLDEIGSRSSNGNDSENTSDESNVESQRTIKRGATVPFATNALHNKGGGSLPSIPAAASSPQPAPVVRKLRRFSVSPTTSTFDLAPTLKPKTTQSSGVAPLVGINNNNKIAPLHEEHCLDPLPATPIRKAEEDTGLEVEKVVHDLVNYVVYEEKSVAERKRSLLLQGNSLERPDPKKLLDELAVNVATPTTPSRVISIAEELSNESDSDVVESVLRGVVREVLKVEKEELRSNLEKRRSRLLNSPAHSQPSTPV
ncbi:unnamed protein product, partial [Mesorhabditis spiculigera]